MTLSEYLIEAVAKRKTGKYDVTHDRDSILEWLSGLGFTKVQLTFGKKDKEYRPDIIDSDGLFSRITVHCGDSLYAVTFKNSGELESIKKCPLSGINIKYTPIDFNQFKSEIE